MTLPETLEKLKEMTAVQCSDGNWDWDPYMYGMANGMICAVAVMTDEDPKFLEAPAVWGRDRASEEKAPTAQEEKSDV